MGMLDRLFGRTRAAPPPLPAKGPCLHITLVPRWGSVADMGEGDKVSGYTCDGCQRSFTAEDGRALRLAEAERLQQTAAV